MPPPHLHVSLADCVATNLVQNLSLLLDCSENLLISVLDFVSFTSFFFLKNIYFVLYVSVCTECVYMYLLCTGAHRSQKMASGLLELELQMVVSRHVDSRKQILALWKRIQGSYLLSRLSSPLAFPLLRNSSDYIITFIRKCTLVSHPMLG